MANIYEGSMKISYCIPTKVLVVYVASLLGSIGLVGTLKFFAVA